MEEKKMSFWQLLWTSIKVCVIILLFPVIAGVFIFLAMVVFPIFFVFLPIIAIAWLWLLFA